MTPILRIDFRRFRTFEIRCFGSDFAFFKTENKFVIGLAISAYLVYNTNYGIYFFISQISSRHL